ncbi:MAG: GspE/PulE family protein [Paracoccaceae bacterium]
MNASLLHKDLKAALQEAQAIDPAAIARADALAQSTGLGWDRAVLKLGLVEEAMLLRALARVLKLEFVEDATNLNLSQKVISQVGLPYLRKNRLAPLGNQDDKGPVHVLTSDPCNDALMDELHFQLERPITVMVAASQDILTALERATQGDGPAATLSSEQANLDRDTFAAREVDGPVIQYVSNILAEAVSRDASDVHFASADDGLDVRFRINGVLARRSTGLAMNASAVFARIKVMAGMNVAERRKPQDGRMTTVTGGRMIDFRVSSLPTQLGESIVCRVLDPRSLRLGWSHLGFAPDIEQAIRETIEQPSGLFLVTGPTGSGKTTTLYTALNHLRSERRKIISVEDPVEYQIPDVEQVQIHEDVGLSFATALRSILRQDPNVIMVGEIRDRETAEIVCRAALVGRMVLSTLHTKSPADAITRLVDLGVDEFIVRDVLRGVLGQELEIVKCPECGGQKCAECNETGALSRKLKTEFVTLHSGRDL